MMRLMESATEALEVPDDRDKTVKDKQNKKQEANYG